ncbi:MAG: osmotically inducible protein C [Mesoaciditoga sp.]|uniref:OsmC family protein n=1 Tax=Athalassotoga sp. TaxID=2022597 RepID=UPI000CC108F3|nr:MAG: osmotically inducible protein C [Mesoaciditoga sp.]PMP80310.1 MAG: osmotically inducible protein C [Mesoaciditoga sp.]HEU23854.1 OsmC family peroxiredoxin [Mesoaciditoga lauensis]
MLTLNWSGKMKFTAHTESNHEVVMDAYTDVGGEDSAARPMEVLLAALAGCTAMDVISILEKMKTTPRDFKIEISYTKAKEHPKVYTDIHLKYIFYGNVPKENAEKAVNLSQTKYCSVSAMLRKAANITYELVFES